MKKIISTILLLVAMCALILTGAENADGSVNIIWSLSCLVVLIVCVKVWEKLNPKEDK